MKTHFSDREVEELLRQADRTPVASSPPPDEPQNVLTDSEIKHALETGKRSGAIEVIEDSRRSE